MSDSRVRPLGRRPPHDDEHLVKYPLRAVMPETVATVERVLPEPPPAMRRVMDQGVEGSCVG